MTNQKIQRSIFIAIAASLLLLLASINAVITNGKPLDEEIEYKHYCEMVQLYKDTGGQYGWPAYKGEC